MKRLIGSGLGFAFFVLYHAATASAAAVGELPYIPPPAYYGTYSCDLTLRDLLGRPQAGKVVTLSMGWRSPGSSSTTAIVTATGLTDASGHAFVTTAPASSAANTATCSVNVPDPKTTVQTVTRATYFTSGMVVGPFVAESYPQPDATFFPPGLNPGVGRADLYRSGAYDKVLIVPEYFDSNEHSPTKNRDRLKYFDGVEGLVQNRYDAGWDVWLFQPNDTGQNLHEQAAELAQTIRYASAVTGYGKPSCGSNEVSVFGLSTAGVVARIATARWEYDTVWRSQVGMAMASPLTLALPATLPVNLIATGDSPNYGMHLNLDMQASMWSKLSGQEIYETTNLDSCAATQLLRKHWMFGSSVLHHKGEFSDVFIWVPALASPAFHAFFADGTPVSYYSKKDKAWYTCAAGPAVATMNSANGVPGWPSTALRVGYSNGASGEPNRCYGLGGWNGTEDRDVNGSGVNVCPYKSDMTSATVYTPHAGDNWMHIDVDDWFDKYWSTEDNIYASDIGPGSRNPTVISTTTSWWGGPIYFEQRFSPTLIPWKSASGTEGVVGANKYATVAAPWSVNLSTTEDPTDTWWSENTKAGGMSGVADVPYELNVDMLSRALTNQGDICPVATFPKAWL